MADEITDAIEQAATEGIASVSIDGETTTARSIPDLIAADKHLANKRVAVLGPAALGFVKTTSPNALGE